MTDIQLKVTCQVPNGHLNVPRSERNGREAVRQLVNAQGCGPSPVEYQSFDNVVVWETTDPEVAIAEYEPVGKIVASGEQFHVPNLLVLRVRDGQVLLTRSYFNPNQFAELLKSE